MEQILNGMQRRKPLWTTVGGAIVISALFLQFYPAGASERYLEAWTEPAVLANEPSFELAILADIIAGYHTFLDAASKEELPRIIIEKSQRYGFDPLFVAGLITTESSFNNRAVSSAGARGLMQIIPYVGKAMAEDVGIEWQGLETLHNPEVNIELGLYYLRSLELRFGNLDLALAAYNMGPSLLDQKMARGFRPHGLYAGRVNGSYQNFRNRADTLRQPESAEASL